MPTNFGPLICKVVRTTSIVLVPPPISTVQFSSLCSKCPPLADTHACSRLRKSFTALSMDLCDKADLISCSAFFNSGIVCGFGCSFWWNSSIAPKRDNPLDWGQGNWVATRPWWWSHCSLTSASPVWHVPCELERRLAGRGSYSVAAVHSLPLVLATVFPGSMPHWPSPSHPQSADAPFCRHTLQPTPWHEGQTSPSQPANDEVQCQSTRPHAVVLVIDGWI